MVFHMSYVCTVACLYQGHCCFIYGMLRTATCFVPWALLLYILHAEYSRIYCAVALLLCAKGTVASYIVCCVLPDVCAWTLLFFIIVCCVFHVRCFVLRALMHLIAWCILPFAMGTAAFSPRVLLLHICMLCTAIGFVLRVLLLHILYDVCRGHCCLVLWALLLYILYAVDRHTFVCIAASYMLYAVYWHMFGLWILVLHISHNVYCCVLWVLPLCALSTIASLLHAMYCHVFCALGIAASFIIHSVLPCLCRGHNFALCMYSVMLHALFHGYCCLMYCMWCVSTTDILLNCASIHVAFPNKTCRPYLYKLLLYVMHDDDLLFLHVTVSLWGFWYCFRLKCGKIWWKIGHSKLLDSGWNYQ